MCVGRSVCVWMCVFSFCCALKGNAFSIQELTVTGKDLVDCGKQEQVCVTSSADCVAASDVPTAAESFVNISCWFLLHDLSFSCRWIQINRVPPETSSSFIFRRNDKRICPAILNFYSRFNLTIKSKSVLGQQEWLSGGIPVRVEDIVQAPRPVITSVSVTDSSINVTWNGGKMTIVKCRIRYKRLDEESWTETAGFPAADASRFGIQGLQAFSEFRLSVSCVHDFGGWSGWSDWSEEARVTTSESPPAASPSLSYYVDSDGNSGIRRLLLLWKALSVSDARGIVREYEVCYSPVNRPSLKKIFRTADLKKVLLVTAEEYEVTVWALNGAGRSPPHRLRIDASRSCDVRPVKSLWVYSDGSSLRIRWDRDSAAGNVSEFAIEWSAATNPELTHWQRVDGHTLSARLTGIRRDESYSVSVFPVYGSLCGPATSIAADLQHGALLELVGFRLVSVSRSSLAVRWMWTEAEPRVDVRRYRLVLSGAHGSQSLAVFPDQQQHSFHQLHPNTQYSVRIHGETATGNFTKASLDVSTPLIDYDEMMRFVVPVLLLLLVFGIFSVSSRTVCRKHFFPLTADPRDSVIGRWLLNPHLQGDGKIRVLKLESLFPFGQPMEKNLLRVEPRVSLISESEEAMPSQISALLWKHSSDALTPCSPPEYVALPATPDRSDYVQNGQIVSQLSEKTSD